MANLDSVTKKQLKWQNKKGSKIFMDADSYRDELLDAISWIDIFIGSEFVYEKDVRSWKKCKENCEYLYNRDQKLIFTFGEKAVQGIQQRRILKFCFDVDGKNTVEQGCFSWCFLSCNRLKACL